jgi:Zn-dependent protease with chaperone function
VSFLVRVSLLLLLAATVGLPAVTAHSAWQHLMGLPGGMHAGALAHRESLLLLGLTGVTALPLVRLAIASFRALRASRRLARVVASADEGHHDGVAYIRVPDPRVSLFVAGFVRTRIYVTQGAEDAMPPALLHAGLLHELAHLRGHHPRWLAILAVLRYAYRLLPGGLRYFEAVRLEAERQADRWALTAGARRTDLFDAIALAATANLPRDSHQAASAVGAVGVEQRLRWIALDEPGRQRLPIARAALSSTALWAVPLAAHGFLWMDLISGVTSHHAA